MPFTNTTPSLPFASGSPTSRDAAIRIAPFVGKQGMDVLDYFRERGARGATQIEVSAALGIARASICARVRALEQAGSIVKSVTERRGGAAVYYINER